MGTIMIGASKALVILFYQKHNEILNIPHTLEPCKTVRKKQETLFVVRKPGVRVECSKSSIDSDTQAVLGIIVVSRPRRRQARLISIESQPKKVVVTSKFHECKMIQGISDHSYQQEHI